MNSQFFDEFFLGLLLVIHVGISIVGEENLGGIVPMAGASYPKRKLA